MINVDKEFICPNKNCYYWDEEYTQDCLLCDVPIIEDYCPFVKERKILDEQLMNSTAVLQKALELALQDEDYPEYKKCPLETFCVTDYCAFDFQGDNCCLNCDNSEYKCWANYYKVQAIKEKQNGRSKM